MKVKDKQREGVFYENRVQRVDRALLNIEELHKAIVDLLQKEEIAEMES